MRVAPEQNIFWDFGMYRQKLLIDIVHKYIKEILQEKGLFASCLQTRLEEGDQGGEIAPID